MKRIAHCRWCGKEVEIEDQTWKVMRSGAIVLIYCNDACDRAGDLLADGKITYEEFDRIALEARNNE